MDKEKYRFKKKIEELEDIEGQGTELISIYLPPDYNVNDMVQKLREEESEAQNIKSKRTRKNVTAAIKSILGELKKIRKPPENGLIVFCGNIGDRGKQDIQLQTLEPPEPVPLQTYRCDSNFFVEPLKDMLEPKNIYGLLTVDRREATVALLKGKRTEIYKHMNSQVPGKHKAGGQCVHENSFVQTGNGVVKKINEIAEEEKVLSQSRLISENSLCSNVFSNKRKKYLSIKTKNPALTLDVTPEHWFFVPDDEGTTLKYGKDLEEKDKVLSVKKTRPKGKEIKFNEKTSAYNFPEKLTPELAQLIGYITGNGNKENYGTKMYEKNRKVAEEYAKIIRNSFNKEPAITRKKNYYKIEFYGKKLTQKIEKNFPESYKKSNQLTIPKKIMKAKKKQVAGYAKGLFDAEGHVDSGRIKISTVADNLINQLQTLLLRFGIISSTKQKTKKSRQRELTICDSESIQKFKKHIGFSSNPKKQALKKIKKKKATKTNSIPVTGRYLKNLVRKINMNTEDFSTSTNFFRNKRGMSYKTFKKDIINPVKERKKQIKEANPKKIKECRKKLKIKAKKTNNPVRPVSEKKEDSKKIREVLKEKKKELLKKTSKVLEKLNKIKNSDLIQTEIKQITQRKKPKKFFDLTIPKTKCFIANNLVLHNSQARFERATEIAAQNWFKKVGEVASKAFEQNNVEKVLVGGPGPTKENFLNKEHLKPQIQKKVAKTINTSYTDEFGIEEMVKKASEVMEELETAQEKRVVKKFLEEVSSSGLATYGKKQVEKALNYGKVKKLLISEDLTLKKIDLKCPNCSNKQKIVKEKIPESHECSKCNTEMEVKDTEDYYEYLSELADSTSAETIMISTDTPEGEQFLSGFGGIGAILRFK